jgi:hypothetical protein
VSSAPYRVELTQTANASFEEIAPEKKPEVLECLESLARDPFPGPGSKAVRIRTSPPSVRFYVSTERFGILFSVDGDLVQVLVIDERPVLG